ncbi:MAG TPA: PilZ domain-containing protein [Sphingobium sp.]
MAATTEMATATHASVAPGGYPPREYRRPVIVEARMRADAGWVTVCIRNISAHGLMGQTATPPPPGTYIEIHRGAQTIIGRTVWARGRKFGVRAQDILDIEAIIGDPVPIKRGSARLPDGGIIAERRSDIRRPSIAEQHEESIRLSQKCQSLFFLAVGMVAAGMLAYTLYMVLADMAGVVTKNLG